MAYCIGTDIGGTFTDCVVMDDLGRITVSKAPSSPENFADGLINNGDITAKDVGEVLRDYRNYIHPEKELKHGVSIGEKDTKVFWIVFQTIAEQVIESV